MSSVTSEKRTHEEVDAEDHASSPKRRSSMSWSLQQWKFWLVKNYTLSEGSMLTCGDIIEHAEKERESLEMTVALHRVSLGAILKDVWGEKVKRAGRKRCFSNIACRQYPVRSSDLDLAHEFVDLAKDNSLLLPKGWFKIVDSQSKVSFVHPETWEFDGQRIYTEIAMELSPEKKVELCIKSHGSVITLADLNVEKIIQDLPLRVQAETIIKFVESSQMCLGYCLPQDGSIITLIAHKVGMLKSLCNNEILPQKAAFSSKCQLFCNHAVKQCPECSKLKKADLQRKSRREQRTSIHSNCNKRYLTKEEIQQQLKDEQKLKQKYLQEIQENQSSDSEDDENMSEESNAQEEKDGKTCLLTIRLGSEVFYEGRVNNAQPF
ncbi:hypothetical protein ACROYT_G037164 [Oculina patagonica]